MGGIKTHVYLYQSGTDVLVYTQIDFVKWQIYELPVDLSVDPKLRCRPEYVGRFLQYSGKEWDYIYNVTTTSLILRSVVLVNVGSDEQPVACGSIIPYSLPSYAASAEFMSGVFGRIYIAQWSGGEYSTTKD